MNEEIIKNSSFEPMGCREVGSYLPLFVLGGRGMTLDECAAVKHHLQTCSRCARAYKETNSVVNLLQSQQETLIERGLFSRPVPEKTNREPTIEESFEEFQNKLQRSKARARRNIRARRLKVALKASAAVAACIVIGFSIIFVLSVKPRHEKAGNVASRSDISNNTASIKIELVSAKGKTLLPSGETIETSSNELKTLLINDKHKMVLNGNTVLAVEPLVADSLFGCKVQLSSGQIYTHVEHDGNLFLVSTPYGDAVITGTTFDIKATGTGTTLVVSEGTVQFESESGLVNVTAGQTSEIVGQSAPSIPLSCNTNKLTAWATGYKSEPTLASNKSLGQTFELPHPEGGTLKLDGVNYEFWVREKRNWFKREFPAIFKLKDCLDKEGIKADYPELLIRTGDIWQFNYPDDAQGRIALFNSQSLEKTAALYGYDKLWLEKNISRTFLSHADHGVSQNPINISAFESWLKAVFNKSELDDRTLFSSWHAVVYLIETRSLIWFAVKNGAYDLTRQEQGEILELLQRQVDAACISEGLIRKLYRTDPPKELCGQSEYQQLIDGLAENIETISSLEKEIAEYEICK